MSLGTVRPRQSRSKPRPRLGSGGRPPLDRPRGWGGGGGGHGDGLPDYGERLRRYRFGLAIALVSIVTLFLCMGIAFILRQGFDVYDPSTGAYIRHWQSIHLPVKVLWVNTLILIGSSITLELARRQAINQAAIAPALRIPGIADDERAFPWLSITVVLGLGFLAGQTLAWIAAKRAMTAPPGVGDSFFYILTATHAFHVAGGIVALVYALTLSWRHKPHQQRRIVVDVTSWYWHVIGVLWIYLFAILALGA
jgi:cytochrome c oxidase subunit III